MKVLPPEDRRQVMSPIPDNLEDYLSVDQKKALDLLGQVGWSLAFVRRINSIPAIIVVQSPNKDKYAVLLENGELGFPSDLKVRFR